MVKDSNIRVTITIQKCYYDVAKDYAEINMYTLSQVINNFLKTNHDWMVDLTKKRKKLVSK